MLYESNTQEEWNKMNQEERYREDLEYEVFTLYNIAKKIEQFEKTSRQILFDLCKKEKNMIIEEFDGGGMNYPSNHAIKLNEITHEMTNYKMVVENMSNKLRGRLDRYENNCVVSYRFIPKNPKINEFGILVRGGDE